MSDDRPRRAQSQTERDTRVPKERPVDDAIPEFSVEVDTGVLHADARLEARRRKSPSERIERVEERVDEVTVSLIRLEAKTDGQTALMETIQRSVERIESRDDLVFEGKLSVHKAQAIAAVADDADKKRQRRERITLAIKGIVGGGALIEIVHRWFL